jgi:hypothetical protein
MRKILIIYTSFIVACTGVIVAFITATTYVQLAVAILLYPVLVFFAYKLIPIKTRHHSSAAEEAASPIQSAEVTMETKSGSVGISDIDKRVFLKLIGAAGVFLFFFSIFNKKAEGLFFKNLPGNVSGSVSLQDAAGNKINPAQSQPMDGYRITEIEDNVVSFSGFTNKDGAWVIMRVDTDTGSFRYSKGDSNFPGSWTNREKLKYDYFNNIF